MANAAATRLFVGKLTEKTTQEDLTELFSKFGSVTQVDKRNGFGFIYFENPADAHEAVTSLNGEVVDDQPITVEHARNSNNKDFVRGKPVKRLDLRLVIHGLEGRLSWQDLKDWARQAGDVTFANVYTKDDAVKGVVEFAVSTTSTKDVQVDVKERMTHYQIFPLFFFL